MPGSLRTVLALLVVLGAGSEAAAAIVASDGSVAIETSPHAPSTDGVIFAFDEQRAVAFVSTQPLEFGSIAPGTLVDSHYVQFDPASPSGLVGSGSISFDGPILGVATSTEALTADLSPDVTATSDVYFGLESSIGPYPAGAIPSARGLGSPEDDLIVNLGSQVLEIDSLEIPPGGAGNVDGFRVFTGSQVQPAPTLASPLILGILIAAMSLGLLRLGVMRATSASPTRS